MQYGDRYKQARLVTCKIEKLCLGAKLIVRQYDSAGATGRL